MPSASPSMNTRREFLKSTGATTSLLLMGTALPSSLRGQSVHTSEAFKDIRSPEIKELAQRALDAAKSTGASYADVRLTRQRERQLGFVIGANEKEDRMVGVRALVDGYWGFAAGALWHPEAVVALAKDAVSLAKTNSLGVKRAFEFTPVKAIADEHWAMPVVIDPFDIPLGEVVDFMEGMKRSWRDAERRYQSRMPNSKEPGWLINPIEFWKQEKAFASTDGSYGTQVLYRTEGKFENGSNNSSAISLPQMRLDCLSPTAAGWELFKHASIHDAIDRAMDKYAEDRNLPVQPTEVGRYEIVMDAESVARLASKTLGVATELDRALGYEANAGGTSYLDKPLDMIGTFKLGSPALTVTASRNDRGGLATVGWDDEGVRSTEISLIEKGVVQAFQTTREGAAWLRSEKSEGGSFHSSGCAYSQTGQDGPINQSANLTVLPGAGQDDYETMIAGIQNGIAFENMSIMTDFQQASGVAWGRAYEIKEGKKTAMLAGAGILFKTTELWKFLTAAGGQASARRYGMRLDKGTPQQTGYHSVMAPPLAFKDVTVVDLRRKG